MGLNENDQEPRGINKNSNVTDDQEPKDIFTKNNITNYDTNSDMGLNGDVIFKQINVITGTQYDSS